MQTVVETAPFLRDADAAGMTEAERFALVSLLGVNPQAGDVIKGSGRKLRFARAGKGKSGGYRVITFYSGENVPVFLLTVYAKGSLGNLTDKQVNPEGPHQAAAGIISNKERDNSWPVGRARRRRRTMKSSPRW